MCECVWVCICESRGVHRYEDMGCRYAHVCMSVCVHAPVYRCAWGGGSRSLECVILKTLQQRPRKASQTLTPLALTFRTQALLCLVSSQEPPPGPGC